MIYIIKIKIYYLILSMKLQNLLGEKILHLKFLLKPNQIKVVGLIIGLSLLNTLSNV